MAFLEPLWGQRVESMIREVSWRKWPLIRVLNLNESQEATGGLDWGGGGGGGEGREAPGRKERMGVRSFHL